MSGARVAIRRMSSVKTRPSPASPDTMPPPPMPLPLVNTNITTGPSPFPDVLEENSMSGLLEPAMEGPPSPESIRAFSKQMKRVSVAEKHRSQQTSSSGSSSLRSLASTDRPSWEDGVGLSRKSSGRSTTSSMRDRPETLQIFGKSIFNRRGKRRESSARETSAPNSSATSSLHSSDVAAEGVASAASPSHKRDTFVPPLFHWRRTQKPDTVIEEHEPRRKLQISDPYNFQHVVHTPRNAESALRSATQSSIDGDFQRARASPMHFDNFSSEAVGPAIVSPENDAEASDGRASRASLARSSVVIPPVRPPRSPVGVFAPFGVSSPPPIPPPRSSSRSSVRPDEVGMSGISFSNRPRTSSGIRHPPPLALSADEKRPMLGHSYSHSADLGVPVEYRQLHTPPAVPDESNWPLTCPLNSSFESALPDVPEEEEHPVGPRKSRASIGSLRGSQSVPMLRQLLQSAGPNTQRPASGASDTLGPFDLFAAQRALKAAMEEEQAGDSLPRENWEDAIDYCYDHEAEADCDYAWDRPSMDLSRDCEDTTPPARGLGARPGLPSTASIDVPALSPSSHLSAASVDEVLTPVMPGAAGSASHSAQLERIPSTASSFRESHGFTLSPSLLIPGCEYHKQMIANERDEYQGQDEFPQYDDSVLLMRKYRASASTTASDNSASDRHYSTTSGSTTLTRLTMSTSSLLDMDGAIPEKEPLATPIFAPVRQRETAESTHSGGMSDAAAFLFDASPKSTTRSSRQEHSPTVENVATSALPAGKLSKPRRASAVTSRGRARTTSLSTAQAPGQYSLFPGTRM